MAQAAIDLQGRTRERRHKFSALQVQMYLKEIVPKLERGVREVALVKLMIKLADILIRMYANAHAPGHCEKVKK